MIYASAAVGVDPEGEDGADGTTKERGWYHGSMKAYS
jgi:hypothetical protein